MLVLGRYRGQSIVIDGPCEILIVDVKKDGKVSVGVTAKIEVRIKRTELLTRSEQHNPSAGSEM